MFQRWRVYAYDRSLPENVGQNPRHTNLYWPCINRVLTPTAPPVRNVAMTCLASTLRLIRVTAAFAVILVLGLSLPSAAHALSGHHDTGTMVMTGVDLNDAPHASHHSGEGSNQNPAGPGSCCVGACVALDVLSLQPSQASLQYEIRWTIVDARLPSLDLITLLRPPKA